MRYIVQDPINGKMVAKAIVATGSVLTDWCNNGSDALKFSSKREAFALARRLDATVVGWNG